MPRHANVALFASGDILYYRFSDTRNVYSAHSILKAPKNGVDYLFIGPTRQTLEQNYGAFNYTADFVSASLLSPHVMSIEVDNNMACRNKDEELLLSTADGSYKFDCFNYTIQLFRSPGKYGMRV